MYLSITDGFLYHKVPAEVWPSNLFFSAFFTWIMIVWSTVLIVYKNIWEQVIIVFQKGDYSLQAFSYTKLMVSQVINTITTKETTLALL